MIKKFNILYKLGKTSREFSSLKWVDKSGQEKQWVSEFFKKNLENIFPKIKLFLFKRDEGSESTEYEFEGGRFDAVCWYPEKQTFVIFEYKSEELDHRAIGQTIYYFNALQEKENQRKLVWDLTNFHPKENGKRWETCHIKWNNLRLVVIASDFAKFRKGMFHSQVIKIESDWYENDDEVVLNLKSEEELFLERISETQNSETKNKNDVEIQNFAEGGEKRISDEEIKEWVKKEAEFVINSDSSLSLARKGNNRHIQSSIKKQVIFLPQTHSSKFFKLKIYLASLNKKKEPQKLPPAIFSTLRLEVVSSILLPRVKLAPFHFSFISSTFPQFTLARRIRIKLYIGLMSEDNWIKGIKLRLKLNYLLLWKS